MPSPLTFPALRKGMKLRASYDTRRTVEILHDDMVFLSAPNEWHLYQLSKVKFERRGFYVEGQ